MPNKRAASDLTPLHVQVLEQLTRFQGINTWDKTKAIPDLDDKSAQNQTEANARQVMQTAKIMLTRSSTFLIHAHCLETHNFLGQ